MHPTGALWTQPGAGKLAVLGSAEMFDDAWLDREDNARVMDWVFRWLRRVRATRCSLCMAEHKCAKELGHLLCLLCVDVCGQDNTLVPDAAFAALGVHALDCTDKFRVCGCCSHACPAWDCAIAITFVDDPCTCSTLLCFSTLGLAAALPCLGSHKVPCVSAGSLCLHVGLRRISTH